MDQHDPAKTRFLAIQAMRLSGLLLGVVGALILGEALPFPEMLGYLFMALGLVGVFIVPTTLAKRWSSRK